MELENSFSNENHVETAPSIGKDLESPIILEEDCFVERRVSSRLTGKKKPFYGSPKRPSPVPLVKKISKKTKGQDPSQNTKLITKAKLVLNMMNEDGVPEVILPESEENCTSGQVRQKNTKLSNKAQLMLNMVEAEAARDSSGNSGDVDKGQSLNHSGKKVSNEIVEIFAPDRDVEVDPSAAIDFGEKTAHARVKETLRLFNKHYLSFIQEEEQRCNKVVAHTRNSMKSVKEDSAAVDVKRGSKRPDLKAITKMRETNTILYCQKKFGDLPGVEVGHRFYSRAEMCVVGCHGHWLNGIDFMSDSYRKLDAYKGFNFPLAVSVVVSGMYKDDEDNFDDIVYTGQGGNDLLGTKEQYKDQELVRGNLALKHSMEQCVPVRVIRGHTCALSYVGKVYTYDGLYRITSYWFEKGTAGFKVYKYKLKRLKGQPTLTTEQVRFVRGHAPKSVSEVPGLVCKDISGGQEAIPVPATNLVDDPPVEPTGYLYTRVNIVAEGLSLPDSAPGCSCKGNCFDANICACAKLNGSDFPYVHKDGGRLVEAKPVVFECGPNCGCGPGCVNRTSQRGLKFRLEVFRTPSKGWAVRSWDFIPAGSPVCEYVGKLMRTTDIENVSENDYIFEIDCLQTMKGLDGRESRTGTVTIPASVDLDKADDKKSEMAPEYCIDAGSVGGVARFINHSCEPNLFVQCVLSSHHDLKLARVVLFAADNISPMQELAYDYGYALDSVMGPDGKIKVLSCSCRAAACRKRLY